jgi:molybdopterin/thiamine biosynthesis adenylyltransferase
MGAPLWLAHRPALARTAGSGRLGRSMNVPAHFVVIGAGGLGCPALLGLEAGGARAITIIDDDRVDLSNLPRQVLYQTGDVGVAKVDGASWSLQGRRRPSAGELELRTLRRRLKPEELPTLLDELAAPLDESNAGPALADPIVLECSDSPSLKFAVHDACLARGLRVVVGGVVGWHGQAMAVDPRRAEAACYRCLFEAPPPRELAPACATAGVAGPAAGTLGHAMALLALGLASSDTTNSPAGVCVHFDLLRGSVRRLAPKPRPDCPTCGPAHHRNFEPGPT